jgi:predicted DNA-binding transcriptional regulator AlpA
MENIARTEQRILTLREVAEVLRCSRTHVGHVINGEVRGLPKLTHFCIGRRKLVRREWLESWMEANKIEC